MSQLDRMCEGTWLTPQEQRVLVFLVLAWLDGKAHEVTGKIISADVLGKDLSAYSRNESGARVTVSSLRKKLTNHYSAEGTSDPIIFQFPPTGYHLSITRRLPLTPAGTRLLWNAKVLMEKRTPSGFNRALELLDKVLAEIPNQPAVLTLKAEILMTRGMYGTLPLPDLKLARELADRVHSKPGADWRAWLVDGGLRAVLAADWKGAFESFSRSLQLRPEECRVHPWYTACLMARGRADEALTHMRQAVDDRGYNIATMRADLSILEILGRDYAAAQTTTETTIELFPNYFLPYLHRAMVYELRGDPERALQALHRTPLKLFERPVTWGFYAYFAGKCGKPERAERRLRWLRGLSCVMYVPGLQLAIAALGAARIDEALMWLERGWRVERDPLLIWLYAYPFCDCLRGIPRFETLVDEIGALRTQS